MDTEKQKTAKGRPRKRRTDRVNKDLIVLGNPNGEELATDSDR